MVDAVTTRRSTVPFVYGLNIKGKTDADLHFKRVQEVSNLAVRCTEPCLHSLTSKRSRISIPRLSDKKRFVLDFTKSELEIWLLEPRAGFLCYKK